MPLPFAQLAKPAQTKRAAAIARKAWRHWGRQLGPLELLNDGFNTVFRADSDRGPIVLRVHRRDARGDNGLLVEFRWTRALTESGFDVPTLLETREGLPFSTHKSTDATAPLRVSAFAWREGQPLSRSFGEGGLTQEHEVWPRIEALGQLAARLHDHTDHYRDLDHLAPSLDRVAGFAATALTRADLPPTLWPIYAKARELCEVTFASKADAKRQLCHADLHAGNILVTPSGALGLLDFDDCAFTWPEYDLGIAAFYLRGRSLGPGDEPPNYETFTRRLQYFERGYASIRPWRVPPPLLATFIVARQLALLNLLATERGPARRASFEAYCASVEGRLRTWLDEGLWPS